MNILLFAGTTEGRLLAERLRDLPVQATICVATAYGGEALGALAGRFSIQTGRLDGDAMRDLMLRGGFDCVIDATHPYATLASDTIRGAAATAGLSRFRLLRAESGIDACTRVDSVAEAARLLVDMRGNVLLATGAKDLAAYTVVPGYAERMYPRILPMEDSIRECTELGFRRGHIIAMQGPFSREVNSALMRHFNIELVTTKDGGLEGGFPEKILAAADVGAHVIVIGRPPDTDGRDLDGILAIIREKLEGA